MDLEIQGHLLSPGAWDPHSIVKEQEFVRRGAEVARPDRMRETEGRR